MRSAAPLVWLGVLAAPSLASADFRLNFPVSRYQADSRTEGPCGQSGDSRGAAVTVVRSGSLLRVQFEETSDHPSHFRISFDPDGQDDFGPPASVTDRYSNEAVLLDGITDVGGLMTADVRLPNIECSRCTLQVIQVLYDQGTFGDGGDDIHYQCADLELSRVGACEDGLDGGTCDSPSGSDSDLGGGFGSDSDLGSDENEESVGSDSDLGTSYGSIGYGGTPSEGTVGGMAAGEDAAAACSAERHRARQTPWAVLPLSALALVRVARRRGRSS
jgi:hypothetical protein